MAATGEAAPPSPPPAAPPPPPPPPSPAVAEPSAPGQDLRDAVDGERASQSHNPAQNVAMSFSIDDSAARPSSTEVEAEPEPEPEHEPVAQEEPEVEHQPLPEPPVADQGEDIAPPPVVEAHGYGSLADEDEGQSPFDSEPPFRPRRNPLKMWTWAAAIFAIVVSGLIFAVSYWGLPDWVPVERPTFAADQPDLQLEFPPEEQERRTLPNGTEFFGASGRITNIGTQTRTVPTILIVLRDARDAIVYSWEVPPPQRELAPGETVTINEAVTDIPRRARFAEFGWKPE